MLPLAAAAAAAACFYRLGLACLLLSPRTALVVSVFGAESRTGDGGTHLEGLKSIVTRTVNSMGRKTGKLKESQSNLGGDFVREVGFSFSLNLPWGGCVESRFQAGGGGAGAFCAT